MLAIIEPDSEVHPGAGASGDGIVACAGGGPPPGGGAEEDEILDGPPNMPNLFVPMPDNQGSFRTYMKTRTVVMHCVWHRNCRLTRSFRGSKVLGREGQGRPLGLVFAWSKHCPEGIDSWEHAHVFLPSREQREAARSELQSSTVPNVAGLFERERPQRRGEPAEPEFVS